MTAPSLGLEGKVALVTGGASGIGRAAALAFAGAGARVVIADVAVPGGEETAAAIVAGGGEARFLRTDVTRSSEVEALVAFAVSEFGGVDCAFNNAGIEEEAAPTADCDEERFDRIIAVNLKGVWLCLKHELRQMLRQGRGAIVNTASVAGLGGAPRMPAYAASKHGVVGLTRTAAAEYARSGVRVNAVCPAIIRTPMLDRALELEPRRRATLERMHPMGRIGEPGEVVAAVLWLCSDQAAFVTGHQLAIDGGLTAI